MNTPIVDTVRASGTHQHGVSHARTRRLSWAATGKLPREAPGCCKCAAPARAVIELALAWAINHPGVTSAIIGPRTMAHFDDQLAAAEVVLSDETLDRIDAIVTPGTDIRPLDADYDPPAVKDADLRRRPIAERAAA